MDYRIFQMYGMNKMPVFARYRYRNPAPQKNVGVLCILFSMMGATA